MKYFLCGIFALIFGFFISVLNVYLYKSYSDDGEKKEKEKFKLSDLINLYHFSIKAEPGVRGKEGVSVDKLRAHKRDRCTTTFGKDRKLVLQDIIISEILTLIISLGVVFLFGINLKTILILIFCYYMISLTMVDARLQILPDLLTRSLIVIGLIVGWNEIFTDFQSSIIGAFAGYFSLWTINTLFRLIRGKEGMGYGDFKLFSAIGAWVGYQQLPLVILMSSIMAIFVAIAISKLYKSELNAPTPFGPSLALAGVISLLWGERIINWYLGFFYI